MRLAGLFLHSPDVDGSQRFLDTTLSFVAEPTNSDSHVIPGRQVAELVAGHPDVPPRPNVTPPEDNESTQGSDD